MTGETPSGAASPLRALMIEDMRVRGFLGLPVGALDQGSRRSSVGPPRRR